jgi:hypothetical protein
MLTGTHRSTSCSSTTLKVGQHKSGKARPANAPVEGVRFPRWWCETMTQHDGDALPDVGGDTGPCRTRPKCRRVWYIFAERRGEKLQRLNMGIVHNLTNPVNQTFRRTERGERAGVVLLASEIAQLQAPAQISFPVSLRRSQLSMNSEL